MVALMLATMALPAQGLRKFLDSPGSPYRIDWRTEAFIIPSGMGILAGAYVADRNKPVAVPGSYQTQNLGRINRHVVKPIQHAPALVSDVFLYGSLGAPALLMIDRDIRRDKSFYLMWAEVILLNSGFTALSKSVFNKPRPYAYANSPADAQTLTGKEPLRSFFSGHTSMPAASLFFLAKVYHDYHPNNKWRYAVWATAATVPAVTGFLRVRAGKHFPADVATGYIVGAATGYFVPWVHQRVQQRMQAKQPKPADGL